MIDDSEHRRLTELAAYSILDTAPEESFDDLAVLAAFVCNTPIALVSLIDECRQWFKARVGIDIPQTPREQAFCAHAVLERQTLIVPDASQDPRFGDNPLVLGAPYIRAYAGMPLEVSGGAILGTLCVIDTVPREFSPLQLQALRVLARQVTAQLELRRQLIEVRALRIRDRQFACIADSAPIGIFLTDNEGLCRYTNPAWCAIAGLTLSDALGAGWQRAIHPQDRDRVFQEWMNAAATRKLFQLEFRFQRPNGEIRWVRAHATALADGEGIVGTDEDITDLVAQREQVSALHVSIRELGQRVEEVRELERADFARHLYEGIAQDLAAMKIKLAYVQKRLEDNAEISALLDTLEHTLIDTMGALRKGGAELRPPELDEFGIGAAARNYAREFTHRSGIKVSVNATHPLPRLPNGTAIVLFRVIQEALNNVFQHAAATAVTIQLTAHDQVFELCISDDGSGTAPESQSQVGKWGLLEMSERVHHLGGTLEFTSVPGRGSVLAVNVSLV